ncbi:O-methyltransferase [Azospirillum sp. RWY-5-1]|uniref:O-methyltransferase n=1 Tax=Azospirillum oleiclasticum TaxID=2735135 RepID=A0ABX2T913_9PROT|nr:O-methyltransferase [Azospirillum oleiclasticum]NYZ12587.1 O-methyltransferase [Azospirillum oleiclasticum]NYZ19747.1 O-methyltransferase [Azospirillum oleiclasticum]
MTTFTTAPVAPLLDRLFAEDDALDPATIPSMAEYWNGLTADEQARLLGSRTDYGALYSRLKDIPLAVSRETGTLLYTLARSLRATSIVEFGTSFGLSTICLAAALRDNGGGRLITSEFEPSKVARARANLDAAGLADLVEFREGDALETLARDLPVTVDLLLLDGAKGLYPDILDRVESRLRPGALVVADNVDFCPGYVARVRDLTQGYLSVPFANDVELSMKLG